MRRIIPQAAATHRLRFVRAAVHEGELLPFRVGHDVA